MGIFSAIEKRMAMGPTGALADSWYSPGGFLYGGAAGLKTKSGASVSELNAMQLAVVWCCIKILSEDTSSLPLHLYRRLPGGGKERATSHPLYRLMHDRPNPEMTTMSFRETCMSHLVSWGNWYAEKEFGRGKVGNDTVVALWPITPDRVKPFRDERRQINYKITMPGGASPVILPKRNVLHIPGMGFNGLTGYSPIGAAREAIGLGMALEEYSELYFGSGTHPGVVVSHKDTLSTQAHSNLEKSLTEAHSGLGKSHRLLLLEEGMTIEKIGIENKDAQFLESKKYTNIEIGTRFYRIPPYMYGEMEKSAWANVEQQSLDYVTNTLRAWLVRIEQALNAWMLREEEIGDLFFEHLVDGLLRGDVVSRYNAYAVARNNGWMNADEIRELENMNPMPDGQGKIYLVPLNMIPASEAGRVQEDQSQPATAGNRAIYRARLESAYRRVFTDAAERIVRKETKRLRWGWEKHAGNGGFQPFADDFYQNLPDYIKRTAFPAFLSLAEAISDMETELTGLKINGNKPEFEAFVADLAARFAADHVQASRAALAEALKSGAFEGVMDNWEAERAAEIASEQSRKVTGRVIERLKTMAGGRA